MGDKKVRQVELALQIDGEQAVLQLGARYADVVGKPEPALEVALGP